MSGLWVGEDRAWQGKLPQRLCPTVLWGLALGKTLTQQPGEGARLSVGATYREEACDEQDGVSKSSNDKGTALLQHHSLAHCTAPSL